MISYTWGFLGTYTNPPDAEIVQDHTPQHLSQVSATFETYQHDIDSYTNSFHKFWEILQIQLKQNQCPITSKNTENLID